MSFWNLEGYVTATSNYTPTTKLVNFYEILQWPRTYCKNSKNWSFLNVVTFWPWRKKMCKFSNFMTFCNDLSPVAKIDNFQMVLYLAPLMATPTHCVFLANNTQCVFTKRTQYTNEIPSWWPNTHMLYLRIMVFLLCFFFFVLQVM